MALNELYDVDQMHADQEAVFFGIGNLDLLKEAKDRYEVFKKYIGDWHFYSCKYDYLSYALREDDILSVSGAIQEIEEVRNHELLKNPDSRCSLYHDAQKYMIDSINPRKEAKKYDTEKLVLMIYLLHEEGYFNNCPLPDQAFEIDDHPNKIEVVGEVYGRYFTFYNYLQDNLKKLRPESSLEAVITNEPKTQGREKESISTFKEMFYDIHKPKFDRMIELLLKDFPIQIINKYSELDRLDGPTIYEVGNKYALNSMMPSPISYLAGIYIVCKKNKWLTNNHTLKEIKKVVGNTFSVRIGSPTAFKNASYGYLDTKYIEPFRLLFKDIQ